MKPQSSSTELSSDGAALARVAAGELGALASVYERHAAPVMRLATRLVGRDDAEDLVQNTFMKAVVIAAGYDDRASSARSWLFGIAAKLASERRRALLRFGRAVARLATMGRIADTPRAAERLAVERALARLSPRKRVVVVLADIEGYTSEQIGVMLGIPVGTVWTRLHHARKELRSYYDMETR